LSLPHAAFVSYLPDMASPLTVPWKSTAPAPLAAATLPKLRLGPVIVPLIVPSRMHPLAMVIVPVTVLPATAKTTLKPPLALATSSLT